MINKTERQDRIETIKSSLRKISVLSKNSIKVQAKEEKIRHRRQSLELALDSFQSARLLRKFSDEDQEEQRNTLNSFSEKYRLLSYIGEGANATVHTCEYMVTGKMYAVKMITMDEQHLLQLKKNFLNIKMLRHPNIIRYHALYFDLHKHLAYLIMQYFPFKNLTELGPSDEGELKVIFTQVLSAISYIHERNICHRDIKPQNILYDPVEKRVKLIDFGISKRTFQRGQRRDMLTIIGTSQYLAPEILTGGGYDERVDMWSTGVTLYRLISGATPFESIYHSDTIASIIKGNIVFSSVWDSYSFFVKDITLRMLKPREERLSAKEALRHLWICQGSPKLRKGSQAHQEERIPRHDSFNLRVFKVFAEEESLNLKHAKAREEGEEQPEEPRPVKAIRLNLMENNQFDLEDSGEESSPSTGKSWSSKVKKKTWGSLFQ